MPTMSLVSRPEPLIPEAESAFSALYASMGDDEMACYYQNDSIPDGIEGFREAIRRETFGMLLHDGETPWALCLMTRDGAHKGQVQLYIMPDHRHQGVRIWGIFSLGRNALSCPLVAYIHPEHRQAQMFARQVIGLHRVQRLPHYTSIQGKAVDMLKYAEVTP